ncbi:ABC transporter permease [Aureimonas jatrophae]|uniref:Peptide/nickel transport system permease protein n=1 Tax=Aureimonas jatrophae TaxID=1166073 RepID=A0A1H0KL34_9HYPH|nr:ABC transporter permease [Aureimonas jatrophae]MBB3948753.1 peptide/nickel transport system permease protein [Aureimonas jatrophae]SDO56462.1 peptide/nickel transport system permease protein [Aureimonas jatrophae]
MKGAAGVLLMLVGASLIIFLAANALPGDPAAVMLGTAARPDTLAALRLELGLDRPILLRWLEWLGDALRGDLGRSLTYGTPVSVLVGARLALTLPLAFLGFLLAAAIGLGLGLLSARRPGGWLDRLTTIATQAGTAVPAFVVGLCLVLLASRSTAWPTGGFPGWQDGFLPALQSLALPTLALALPQGMVLARVARAALMDVGSEDYMRTARAKGLSRGQALRRHALPNSLVAVATVMGLQFSFLVGGAVLVETVFALPGLGQLAVQSLQNRDLVTLQAVALLLVATVIGVNALVDFALGRLDPRWGERP